MCFTLLAFVEIYVKLETESMYEKENSKWYEMEKPKTNTVESIMRSKQKSNLTKKKTCHKKIPLSFFLIKCIDIYIRIHCI